MLYDNRSLSDVRLITFTYIFITLNYKIQNGFNFYNRVLSIMTQQIGVCGNVDQHHLLNS